MIMIDIIIIYCWRISCNTSKGQQRETPIKDSKSTTDLYNLCESYHIIRQQRRGVLDKMDIKLLGGLGVWERTTRVCSGE